MSSSHLAPNARPLHEELSLPALLQVYQVQLLQEIVETLRTGVAVLPGAL